jgi:hypothetical protein
MNSPTFFKINKHRMVFISPRFQYNFKQLRLPSLIVIALIFYDVWFLSSVDTGRDFQKYIDAIRRMNDYCSFYLVFISVLIGIANRCKFN